MLRPEAFADVAGRHQLFADAGIGPAVLHADPQGLLVLERAAGEKLCELLSAAQRGESGPPPGPRALIAALDRLPDAVCDLPAHPSWTSKTGFHARLAAQALPQLSAYHCPQGHEVLAHWYAEFVNHVHPGALAVRVAGVLLSLVGNNSREVALHRLDLVRSWLLRAAMI